MKITIHLVLFNIAVSLMLWLCGCELVTVLWLLIPTFIFLICLFLFSILFIASYGFFCGKIAAEEDSVQTTEKENGSNV